MLADGFRRLRGKRPAKGKEAPLVANPLFVQITEPAYGAIAVVVLPHKGRGKHVGFVHGRSSKTHICVLGGNQSDTVCFTDYRDKETIKTVTKVDKKTKKKENFKITSTHLEYYMPALYYPTYEKSSKSLTDVNAAVANKKNEIKTDKKKNGKTN